MQHLDYHQCLFGLDFQITANTLCDSVHLHYKKLNWMAKRCIEMCMCVCLTAAYHYQTVISNYFVFFHMNSFIFKATQSNEFENVFSCILFTEVKMGSHHLQWNCTKSFQPYIYFINCESFPFTSVCIIMENGDGIDIVIQHGKCLL